MLENDQIENDEKLYEIARLIDNDFYLESIREQIESGLDCTTVDYLSTFYMKVEQVKENYQEEDYGSIIQFTEDLCENIINWIKDKYDIDIYHESEDLEKIAKSVYHLFVIELRDIIISGIVSYIIEKHVSIIESIGLENLKTSLVPEDVKDEDEKYRLITAGNIGLIVEELVNFDIPFEEFITYASRRGDSDILKEFSGDDSIISISDAGSVFSNMMNSIKESEFDHEIILTIYEKIIGDFGLSSKEVTIYGDNYNTEYPDDEE